jgi:hypothetical protein
MSALPHDSEALPFLDGLTTTAYALAALSVLVWLGSFLRRQYQLRREARETRAEAELTELILDQTAQKKPDAAPLARLSRLQQGVLLRVLTSLLEQLQGAGRERLIAVAGGMGVRQTLNEVLRCGRIRDRINAAVILGNFRDEAAASSLTTLLHDSEFGVRLAAARALLNHPHSALTLREFLEALRFSDRDPSIALADIFDHLPSHWHAEAIAMLRGGLPATWRRMLAIALGRSRIPGALEAVTSLLGEDDPRLRAAAWVALAELADQRIQDRLLEGLVDPSADVRVTACHCAKRLRVADCIPSLTRLLRTDTDWWVRYRAAQALVAMGGTGRSAILSASAESENAAGDVGLLVLREFEAEAAHAC